MSGGSWIVHRVANPRARVRLVCYPNAGGGASAFSSIRRQLPEWVELCPLEPPGRWSRHGEPPLRSIVEAADGLVSELEQLTPVPTVLLGHSVGGFVMFEAARRLERPGSAATLAHLVIAARSAPTARREQVKLHALTDDALLRSLSETYGAERLAALDDPELRELFMPPLRADLEALETYAFDGGAALEVSISAYGGRADPTLSEEGLAAWRAHTRGRFHLEVLEGDHFFIHDARSGFLEQLLALVETAVSR
jgi:medium-chain acyl-[acyl-carrier-protein] hydrolase